MINEKHIYKSLKKFSFPRQSGMEFEKKGCNLDNQKIRVD